MNPNKNSSIQRLKLLCLRDILLEKTDEDHPITMGEIINQLNLYGISAGRKALYEDIEALRTYGMDIKLLKGNTSGYYLASREFELPELKLLADAVTSSRFLTEKKSNELLKKIEGLASKYEAKQIQRQVFIANRVKAMNERIYINVDTIHRAISEGKKISFKYFDYDLNKKKKYRDGLRICSPYSLSWDDERYYLISYYDKYNKITNFRIDRMEAVTILDEVVKPKPDEFNVAEYMNSSFSMFSGDLEEVKLRFDNKLINPVIDRFGKDITIVPDGEENFTVRVKVKAEPPFFAWLFQFGNKVRIIEPNKLIDNYQEQLKSVLSAMN